MNRVILDTNVVVSAVLVPTGTQAAVLLLALTGRIAIYVSPPVLVDLTLTDGGAALGGLIP
jgi:predicted nucleic acid-binding protein